MQSSCSKLLVLALTLSCASCAVFGRSKFGARSENATELLDQAEAEMASGDLERALDRLLAVREVEGLLPEVRARDEELIRRCADLTIAHYESEEYGSGSFKRLYNLDLPLSLKARAGILAAEKLLEEGSRIKAYRQVKKVDAKLPTHPERALAGDIVASAGLSLARDERRYYLLFKYKTRGLDALEYLVLQYPYDPHCPEAYYELATVYEDRDKLDLAIERLADLLVYHPDSAYSTAAEARLPYLRLERLQRDDYDRKELEYAHRDVQRWLQKHPGHDLEPWVRELGQTCEARLTANDLYLARYYARLGSVFGTRLHAERALRTAEAARLDEAAAEARAILARLPADSVEVELLPKDESSFLDAEDDENREFDQP